MSEEAKITFYNIDRCGYYRRGENTPRLSNVSDIFHELQTWISGKTLGQTKTFDTDEENEINPVYCYNLIKGNNGDFLLTTWNAVPSSENAIASIDPNSRITSPHMYMNQIHENSIPGFATYFWIIPEENLLATITFHHRINGHRALLHYIKDFMRQSTSYTVIDPDEDSIILGYRKDEADDPENLLPAFKTSMVRLSGHIQFLRDNVQIIRKIIRKKTLHLNIQRDESFLRLVMEYAGLKDFAGSESAHNIKYELSHTPSIEEFDQMVYNTDIDENDWEDTGLLLKNDSKIYWLSHSYARNSVELYVERTNEELIESTSLLNALINKRRQLIQLFEQRDINNA